jgi:hypothetical protein
MMISLEKKSKGSGAMMERHSDESSELVDGVRLIARPDIVAGPEDWPPVWFAFAQHRWNSMVLVPAHAGVSVLAVARALADAGRTYDEPSLGLIEAERVPPSRVQGIVTELRDRSDLDQRTIVAVASPLDDNSAVPIEAAMSRCSSCRFTTRLSPPRAARSPSSVAVPFWARSPCQPADACRGDREASSPIRATVG